ncbi:MAG: ferrous iron transport protein B [Oscillospiraceae bacterium]
MKKANSVLQSDELFIKKEKPEDKIIALAGNPNVGKSTVFNSLTGLNQHTGNWPGKTVTSATGRTVYENRDYILVDLPGTYSLFANSVEEEVARNFICFGEADAVVVVCDATCLERNLNLVLQTLEITDRVILCLNLMDEAKKKNININTEKLSSLLGVKVVATNARSGEGLGSLMQAVKAVSSASKVKAAITPKYNEKVESAIRSMSPVIEKNITARISPRWVSLRLLEKDEMAYKMIKEHTGCEVLDCEGLNKVICQTNACVGNNKLRDDIVSSIVSRAEHIFKQTVSYERLNYNTRDRKIDNFLTSKYTGIPVMILLLLIVFWITITGANYPSQMISNFLLGLQEPISNFLLKLGVPMLAKNLLVNGVYRVVSWVVAVMLPPMAIFFPLFTLLEDFGYLPRVAFNLDNYFRKANTCGKQALTMCMGFGCNAAGVTNCRIIDSPRERLIAIITNSFVPCNGRFPTLIAIITMFFATGMAGFAGNAISSLILMGIIIFSVLVTLAVSKVLSMTILKGVPSSFTLELPPYRRPQLGKVIVRSIFDRTLFVLGRAVVVAAPAGVIIWLMANIHVGNTSVLLYCSDFFDPFARLLGLDGVILLAFILGFPANEIVVPIILMAYLSTGQITDFESYASLHQLLIENGWTWITAICVMVFSLMHWPCSTTCLTIKKETKSFKWTAISIIIPTVLGMILCFVIASIAKLFS